MTTQTLAVPMTYSQDFMPDGDCYAPQVVLTNKHYGWTTHELNTDTLPVDGCEIVDLFDRFRASCNGSIWGGAEMLVRYFRIFYDIEVHHTPTSGYSQGDWGHSFVFATPEWLEMTGAPGINESDHNDFCAWIWGDVYEVHTYDTETHTFEDDGITILYGYDQAKEYSDRVFDSEDEFEEFKDEAYEWVASQPTALELAYKPVMDTFPTAKLFVAQNGTEALAVLAEGSIISITEDGHTSSTETEWSTGYEA